MSVADGLDDATRSAAADKIFWDREVAYLTHAIELLANETDELTALLQKALNTHLAATDANRAHLARVVRLVAKRLAALLQLVRDWKKTYHLLTGSEYVDRRVSFPSGGIRLGPGEAKE